MGRNIGLARPLNGLKVQLGVTEYHFTSTLKYWQPTLVLE